MKHFQRFQPKKCFLVCIALLIVVVFVSLLNQNPWAGFSTRDMDTLNEYEEMPWVLTRQGTLIDPEVDLSEYLPLKSRTLYTLSTHLTYDGSRDNMPYGFIHLDHMYCRVILDGEVLFSFMPGDVQKWDSAKSPGFIYKAFPMPRDCLGKNLEIQLLPALTTPVEYGMPDLTFGDFTTSIHATVVHDMPHNVVTILCIFLGIAAILFSAATLTGSSCREGISIGIFSLLFSLYLITECKMNAYFIGNPYYTYLVNYIAFSLLPVSLMGFMRERLPGKYRKLFTGIIIGELLFFAAELFLHFNGIFDMREIVSVIHLIYFAEVLLITVLIWSMKDNGRRRSLTLQMIPVVIGMFIDALSYWLHWKIGVNDATFTILGVILLLIIELLHIWKSSISIYTESVRSNLYREMAFEDELTGAGNRRSYDNEIGRIQSGEKTYDSLIVASADVNCLKYVNDHYGHASGDKLIRGAAQVMMDVVGKRGPVFRTGGDEFAVFLYDIDLSEYNSILQAGREQVSTFNSENEFPMSLAIGYVQIHDNKILEAVQEADRKMYENKAKMKRSARPASPKTVPMI